MILFTEEEIKQFCHRIDLAFYSYEITRDYKVKILKDKIVEFYDNRATASIYSYSIPISFDLNSVPFDLKLHHLKTLENSPSIINGFLSISKCDELKSLKGISQHIKGDFGLTIDLPEIDDFPKIIEGYCTITNKQLTSLKRFNKLCHSIGDEFSISAPIESDILSLLLIKNISKFSAYGFGDLNFINAIKILSSHYKQDGSGDVLECQEELINNGLKNYAKL